MDRVVFGEGGGVVGNFAAILVCRRLCHNSTNSTFESVVYILIAIPHASSITAIPVKSAA